MHGLSHFHFRESQKSPVGRHQLPGNESCWMTCNSWSLQPLRATTSTGSGLQAEVIFLLYEIVVQNTQMPSALLLPEEASAAAFLWELCARTLVLLLQFHLLAEHQAPSASLHILPCCIPPKKKEAGAPFYTWDHRVILVILCLFPVFSFLKGCLLSGTHHFQVSTLPASSRLLDAAGSSLRTPRHASFLFSRDRREAELGGWHSRKQKYAPSSWKAPNLLPLSSPKVLLAPIPGWLKSWNVTKNWSKPKEHAWSGQNEMKHTPLQTTLGWFQLECFLLSMKFGGNRDFRQHHMLAITLLRLGISGFLLLTPSITATELAVRVRNPSFEWYDQILSHNLPEWQKNMLLVSNKSGNLKCF